MSGLALKLGLYESLWIGETKLFIERIGSRQVVVRIEGPREVKVLRGRLKEAAEKASVSQIQPANVNDLGRRSEGL